MRCGGNTFFKCGRQSTGCKERWGPEGEGQSGWIMGPWDVSTGVQASSPSLYDTAVLLTPTPESTLPLAGPQSGWSSSCVDLLLETFSNDELAQCVYSWPWLQSEASPLPGLLQQPQSTHMPHVHPHQSIPRCSDNTLVLGAQHSWYTRSSPKVSSGLVTTSQENALA